MKGLLLFLLFALLAVEFGFGSVTLELKRHETKREMLLRTGKSLAEFHQRRQRLAKNLRVFSTSKNKQHAAIIAVEDIGFSVPIGFGTPPQMLNLVPSLDNGDTWVVDSKCVGRPDCPETCLQRHCNEFVCDCCSDPTPDHCSLAGNFSSDKSSTYIKDGTTWDPNGQELEKGFLGADTIRLPGKNGPVDVFQTTFVQISELADIILDENKFSGIIGLGMQDETVDGTVPVFQAALNFGLFENPYFTLWLNMKNESTKPDGQLVFGDYADDYCSSVSTVGYLRNSDKDWAFNVSSWFTSATGDMSTPLLAEIRLYFDGIYIPMADFFKLEDALGAQYNFHFGWDEVSCDTKLKMVFHLAEGSPLTLDESDLIFSPDGGKTCLLHVTATGDPDDDVNLILGRTFFHKNCATFSQKRGIVSFSDLKNN